MQNFFSVLFLISLLFFVWGTIAPHHFASKGTSKKAPTRKKVGISWGLITLFFFVMASVTAPAQQTRHTTAIQNDAATAKKSTTTQAQQPQKPQDVYTSRQVTETKPVAFRTVDQDDSSLSHGTTKVLQNGVNGEETLTYSVSYKNGQEQSRSLISDAVTTPPTTKIVAHGTYVAPSPSTAQNGSGYVNTQGNYVPSPSSDPTGASARCVDGTYSYSQSRRGTCSHHGGVAQWL